MQAFFSPRITHILLLYKYFILFFCHSHIRLRRPENQAKVQTDIWTARAAHNPGNLHPGRVAQPANARSEITNTPLHRRYQQQPAQCARTRTLRCRYSRPQQTLARKRQVRLCEPAKVSRDNACRGKSVRKTLLPIHLAQDSLCRTLSGLRCPGSSAHLQVVATDRQAKGGNTARSRAARAWLTGRLQAPAAPGPVAR